MSNLSTVACVGWGGYWRWLRAPLLVEWIWIRRARCSTCRRSHALLPDLVLARRLDAVDVIGRGLATRLTSRLELRPIAEHLDVPHTTLRAWWQRSRVRSPRMLAQCTALAVALAGTAVDVSVGVAQERAAVDVLRVTEGIRPAHRDDLIRVALEPLSDLTSADREQLRRELSVVVSAEALFTLLDLRKLGPDEAIATLVETAQVLVRAALSDSFGSSAARGRAPSAGARSVARRRLVSSKSGQRAARSS